MRYLFLINPIAGKNDRSGAMIPQVHAAAAAAGIAESDLQIVRTEYKGHAHKLAEQAACLEGEVRIYTIGGDGTFNEALCGAMGHDNAAVGCLPYGSGNDFVRSFSDNRADFQDIPAQLAGGTIQIDMIRTQRGYAASITSAGLDAQVAYGIPKFRRIPFCGGEAAYKLSLVKEVLGKRGRRLQFTIDDQTFTEDCLMVAACNGHAYGGGFLAAPEARLDDGILDIFAVRTVPLRRIASLVPPELADTILYFPGKHVEIHPVDDARPFIVNVDGECGPDTSLTA
ncbi:MAG: protein BmrU, partial [Faecalibacterium sp.]|nr:protein BmrU [Faecalibacterium sp.]